MARHLDFLYACLTVSPQKPPVVNHVGPSLTLVLPAVYHCWVPSSIVGSVVTEITPGKYELFYEVGPDRPTLLYTYTQL